MLPTRVFRAFPARTIAPLRQQSLVPGVWVTSRAYTSGTPPAADTPPPTPPLLLKLRYVIISAHHPIILQPMAHH